MVRLHELLEGLTLHAVGVAGAEPPRVELVLAKVSGPDSTRWTWSYGDSNTDLRILLYEVEEVRQHILGVLTDRWTPAPEESES